jgi:hypothetical protein
LNGLEVNAAFARKSSCERRNSLARRSGRRRSSFSVFKNGRKYCSDRHLLIRLDKQFMDDTAGEDLNVDIGLFSLYFCDDILLASRGPRV